MKSAPDVRVVRRRELLVPADNRRMKRLVDAGTWRRIAPGVLASGADWRTLTPLQRHRLRVDEVIERLSRPTVVSHLAAACIWDIDVLGSWPVLVDVTVERATGGRSGGALRRHCLGLEGIDRVPYGRHEITTAAQTAIDVARTLPFVRAVTAVDQALWEGRDGGPLTTKTELVQLLSGEEPRRGDARARRVIDAAESLAANVAETRMRLLIIALGFPAPRLQEHRMLRSGRHAYGDMYFPSHDHWLEVDGRGKYLSPEFGAGRDPAAIVIDEKNRENEIRREVRGFSRLEATDARRPQYVYDVLTHDGLPSSRPRPR